MDFSLLNFLRKKKVQSCMSQVVAAAAKGNDEPTKVAEPEEEVIREPIPSVMFDDGVLHVTVGQWLGLLSSQKYTGNSGITIYTHLDAEELMDRVTISTEEFDEVEDRFGLLLKMAGVDSSEVCVLSQFDKDKCSFNCHFQNRGDDATISLRWGDMIDFGPELVFDYQNESRTYDYWHGNEDRPTRLDLQLYDVINPENGNSFHRFLSPYNAPLTLQNGDYKLSLDVSRPESINYELGSRYVFRLDNEEELQQYLLGLSFPCDISEVYKKICEISVGSVSEFPGFVLKVEKAEKKGKEKKYKTTDMISLKHGQMKKFVMTRDGKTIGIDENGNWSYDSQTLNMSQSGEGDVSYSLRVPNDKLAEALSIPEQYSAVSQEVEDIKVFTKTLLNGNGSN